MVSERARTHSVDSHSYAIATPNDIEGLNQDASSSSSGSECSQEAEASSELGIGLNQDDSVLLLSPTGTGTGLANWDSQDPMFDVSKFLYDTFTEAIESVDMSEALASQAKSSAIINAKSLELNRLIHETKARLKSLRDRFEHGANTVRSTNKKLKSIEHHVEMINDKLRTNYPIEFSQARERIIERQLDNV